MCSWGMDMRKVLASKIGRKIAEFVYDHFNENKIVRLNIKQNVC